MADKAPKTDKATTDPTVRGYYACTETGCSCASFVSAFPCNSVTCCRQGCGHGFTKHRNSQFLAPVLERVETQSASEARKEQSTPVEGETKKQRATDYYRAHCFEDGYIGTWGNIFWGLEQARAHDIDHHGGTETCMIDHKVE